MKDNPIFEVQTAADIGKILRQARQEEDASQETSAGVAGVGVRFLGDLERGKPTVRLGLALQVLERLGFRVWIARRGWKPDE